MHGFLELGIVNKFALTPFFQPNLFPCFHGLEDGSRYEPRFLLSSWTSFLAGLQRISIAAQLTLLDRCDEESAGKVLVNWT
jgi:hypothetical protein